MSITVRPEQPADHAAIAQIVESAFESEAEALLVDRIRTSPGYIAELALVAIVDGDIVGHVMISHAELTNAGGTRTIAMLSPLAVAPEHQSRGIGGELVRAALMGANKHGEPVVVLQGDPAYYGRFGFEHSVTWGIEMDLPDWAPSEAGQVARLDAHDEADPSLRGRLVEPAAFHGLD